VWSLDEAGFDINPGRQEILRPLPRAVQARQSWIGEYSLLTASSDYRNSRRKGARIRAGRWRPGSTWQRRPSMSPIMETRGKLRQNRWGGGAAGPSTSNCPQPHRWSEYLPSPDRSGATELGLGGPPVLRATKLTELRRAAQPASLTVERPFHGARGSAVSALNRCRRPRRSTRSPWKRLGPIAKRDRRAGHQTSPG